MSQIEVGELLYEYTLNITGLAEYGTSLTELTSGKVMVPPEGARFDASFEGPATGEKLWGIGTVDLATKPINVKAYSA